MLKPDLTPRDLTDFEVKRERMVNLMMAACVALLTILIFSVPERALIKSDVVISIIEYLRQVQPSSVVFERFSEFPILFSFFWALGLLLIPFWGVVFYFGYTWKPRVTGRPQVLAILLFWVALIYSALIFMPGGLNGDSQLDALTRMLTGSKLSFVIGWSLYVFMLGRGMSEMVKAAVYLIAGKGRELG